MTYNRREIMLNAWSKYRRTAHMGISFAKCLRLAWYEAKRTAMNGKRLVVAVVINGDEKTVYNTCDLSEAEFNLEVAKRAFCTSVGSIRVAC